MKKVLAALLAAFFLVSFFAPVNAQAGELRDYLDSLIQSGEIIDQANQDTNNHYVEKNEAGKDRRLHEVYRGQSQGIIFDVLDELDLPLLVLTWGDPHGDQKGDHKRYIGYTRHDEDFTNPAFPHDAWAGGYLEDRNWIWRPWENVGGQRQNDFDGKIDYDSISLGLWLQYGDVLAGPDARPDFWNNLLEYVHVLAPPTTYTWGMGRMWHQAADGTIWYASVPLAPKIMENEDYVKYPDVSAKLDPPQVDALPGQELTFTATLKLKNAPEISAGGKVSHPNKWFVKAIVGHDVNGQFYPVTLEPLNGAPEFDPDYKTALFEEGVEYKYRLTVHAQTVSSTVGVLAKPFLYQDADTGDNYAEAKIKINAPNLVAVFLDPGVSGEAEPDTAYTATVVFKNDSDQALTGVPVGAFNRQYRATLKDANGNPVEYADFGPREEKTFTFTYHTPTAGKTRLTGVINADPLEQKIQEITYDDNKVFADVKVRDVDYSSPGDHRLNLQAYSKPGEDIYGEWHDSRAREPFTAKWTDDVHATLTVDRPTPPRGSLDWWEISWAKITYPRVADEFSFGNPVPPRGTVTKWMDVPGRGLEAQKQAKIVFEEDWALDGFPVHNMMTGEDMAVYPKKYPVSVNFKVTYQYTYWVCDEFSCWPVTEIRSYTDTATANLLVNGAGTIPY